jgi:hypothetical protein
MKTKFPFEVMQSGSTSSKGRGAESAQGKMPSAVGGMNALAIGGKGIARRRLDFMESITDAMSNLVADLRKSRGGGTIERK